MTITLHLSRSVQSKLEALATRNGLDIEIVANDLLQQAVEGRTMDIAKTPAPIPANEKAAAALRRIAQMQQGMRYTDGSQTDRFIREGRAGAMYSDDSAE
jgi:hypothetical protein